MVNIAIGLTGYAGSGKDTTADYLVERYGFVRVAFADKLKEFALASIPAVRESVQEIGWHESKQRPWIREALQDIGTAAREPFGDDFWIRQVEIPEGAERVVFTDVRYPNDAEFVRNLAPVSEVVWVQRPGVGPVNEHASEDVSKLTVSLIHNSDEIEGLHYRVDLLMHDFFGIEPLPGLSPLEERLLADLARCHGVTDAAIRARYLGGHNIKGE